MALVKCRECGHLISSTAIECPKCGCPVQPTIKCPDCGKELMEGTEVCPDCGCPLADNAKSQQICDDDINTTAIDEMVNKSIHCPKCDSVLNEGTTVCPVCGCNIVEEFERQQQEEERARQAEAEVAEMMEEEIQHQKRKRIIIICLLTMIAIGLCGWFMFDNNKDDDKQDNPNEIMAIGEANAQRWLVGTFDGHYDTNETTDKYVKMTIDSLGIIQLHIESNGETNESEGKLVSQHSDSICINFTGGYYGGNETSFRIDTVGHRICPEGDAWISKNTKQ